MADNEIILKVSLDGAEKETNKLVKLQDEINRLAAEKKSLNKTEKELAEQLSKNEITQDQYNKKLKENKVQLAENGAAIKANKAAYRENERQLINNTKAQQLAAGSLVQLRAQLSKDTFEYDRLTKANRENTKEGIALKKSIDNQVDALKKLEAETGRNQRNVGNYAGSLKDLKEELNKNIQKFQALTEAERKNDKVGGQLSKTINKQRTEINNINNTLNKTTNTTNIYKKSFGSLRSLMLKGLGALGITAGLAGLVNSFRNAIKTTKDFEQGNANLAAVLGKSRSEITELTNDAKRLGAATSFSASQVSKLQTEFAKLGFNEKEILDATEATLDLAAATGADLAEAAAVAGNTLGGFGLDADQTQRVVDVMAKSFSTSALDIEKFRESMKLAAPAANAVGVSVEETTALLATLSKAGISGSIAGTALSKTFTELNKQGLTLDEALLKVKNSQDQLGTATELVGERANKAFLVLANGTETTDELRKGLNNAGGAAKKMADEQLDTLEGQTKILNSAWEGLVLSLLSGDSAFNSIAKSIVESATGALSFFTNTQKASEALEEERVQLFAVQSQLNDTNTSQEDRVKIIKDLQEKYPDYLGNLNAETATNEELQLALSQVNDQLVNKIALQQEDERVTEQAEKTAKAARAAAIAEGELRNKIGQITANNTKAQEAANKAGGTAVDQAKAVIDALGGLSKAGSGGGGAFGGAALTQSTTAADKLASSISALRSAQAELAEQESTANVISEQRAAILKNLGITEQDQLGITEMSTQASYGGVSATEEEIKATNSLIDAQKELKEQAEELPETTEAEIAAKNKKIKAIDDEIARLKKLGVETEKQNKNQEQKDKEAAKAQNKIIDDKIKGLELVNQLELATQDLTNEEKLAKEEKLLNDINKLRKQKANLSKEELSNIDAETEAKKAEARLKAKGEKEKEEADEKAFKEQVVQDGIDLAAEASNALIEGAKNKADREKEIELAALDAKLQAGTISQEQFEADKLAIEKKAFEKKKKLDLAVIAIDLAKEISAIAAASAANPANSVTFGGAGISQAAVLTGIAVARSAIQAGIVSSQKFAKGGVIHGASHANGGVQIGNGIEAEGGEAIINKKSTSKHLNLLSAINQDGGGIAFGSPNVGSIAKFANGGIAPSVSVQNKNVDLTELRNTILEAQASIKVTNVASETTGVANRVQQIEDSASF